MESPNELDRFRNLQFEDFDRMALDQSLKPHEKIGFPAAFRAGHDQQILEDLKLKVDWTNTTTLIDIGCGCGELTRLIIEATEKDRKQLTLVDSKNVLAQIEEKPHVQKIAGKFPENVKQIVQTGLADVVICYSVFHYIFTDGNPFEFIEQAFLLLKPGGRFLLGDIPNATKRNRFLLTPEGEAFHRKLMNTNAKPIVSTFAVEPGKMDDGFILGLLSRYRNFGVEAYLLPQPASLPLSNSREDILFIKY